MDTEPQPQPRPKIVVYNNSRKPWQGVEVVINGKYKLRTDKYGVICLKRFIGEIIWRLTVGDKHYIGTVGAIEESTIIKVENCMTRRSSISDYIENSKPTE